MLVPTIQKILATTALCLAAMGLSTACVYAHEEVQDSMAPPSINENAASLHKIQQKAANCTGMYFYIEDFEEDAVYMYRLSSAEVKIIQELIAGMSPCTTNMEIDIDPTMYISLCFENTGEKIITSLDELTVVPISEAASDGSYPFGRFALTDSAYTQWQSIIKHALKHKTFISKGIFK